MVCKYSDVSKGENNQQECLQINSHILESSLKENDYRMFWVFRVYRSPLVRLMSFMEMILLMIQIEAI